MQHVSIIDHAIVKDSLRYLRDKKTSLDVFRFHSDRICRWLFAEAIRDLKLTKQTIQTPLEQTEAEVMDGEIVIIPILRAGLAMLPGALQALPAAKVGFVGLKRDEETAVAHEYYWNLPELTTESTVIITDPMLATGGSLHHVLTKINLLPHRSIRTVCVVAAPLGIRKIQKNFSQVKIFAAAIDRELNSKAYILPGLGDYGDRYMGTT